MTVSATSVSLYPRGEARLKEGANGQKRKPEKDESSVFSSHKKFWLLFPRGSIFRISMHLLRYTLYRSSRYYLTAAITSFLSFAIVRLLCRLLRAGSNIKHKV